MRADKERSARQRDVIYTSLIWTISCSRRSPDRTEETSDEFFEEADPYELPVGTYRRACMILSLSLPCMSRNFTRGPQQFYISPGLGRKLVAHRLLSIGALTVSRTIWLSFPLFLSLVLARRLYRGVSLPRAGSPLSPLDCLSFRYI